jgi:hypothetical protein
MMDLIQLSESKSVLDGLDAMVTARIGSHNYVHMFVDVPVACFVVTVAKLADDEPEWFIRGKWATIQAIETRIHESIMKPKGGDGE